MSKIYVQIGKKKPNYTNTCECDIRFHTEKVKHVRKKYKLPSHMWKNIYWTKMTTGVVLISEIAKQIMLLKIEISIWIK